MQDTLTVKLKMRLLRLTCTTLQPYAWIRPRSLVPHRTPFCIAQNTC